MDLNSIVVTCSGPEEMALGVNRAKMALPFDERKKLGDILTKYFSTYGFVKTYEKIANRSVQQIFDEYFANNSTDGIAKIIDIGEVEGIKYTLYEKPESDNSDKE